MSKRYLTEEGIEVSGEGLEHLRPAGPRVVEDSPEPADTKPFTVYLSGPLSGTETEKNAWRRQVADSLGQLGIQTISPQEFVHNPKVLHHKNVKALVEKDLADIERADLVLAHCWKPSEGTTAEIMWSVMTGKPIIAVVPVHSVPWVQYFCTYKAREYRTPSVLLKYWDGEYNPESGQFDKDMLEDILEAILSGVERQKAQHDGR